MKSTGIALAFCLFSYFSVILLFSKYLLSPFYSRHWEYYREQDSQGPLPA